MPESSARRAERRAALEAHRQFLLEDRRQRALIPARQPAPWTSIYAPMTPEEEINVARRMASFLGRDALAEQWVREAVRRDGERRELEQRRRELDQGGRERRLRELDQGDGERRHRELGQRRRELDQGDGERMLRELDQGDDHRPASFATHVFRAFVTNLIARSLAIGMIFFVTVELPACFDFLRTTIPPVASYLWMKVSPVLCFVGGMTASYGLKELSQRWTSITQGTPLGAVED
ncbi:hypothetical protein LTR10_018809 [Elasticomyces elasticus]|uniref:Uncharacterized protein n=1 Tax=Exophiala sideris TaxID=1016849 RepID=A0ABR0J7Q8_9EURO|nr:hypothetical protein LTR10_018809 [Elasticomyces elasticus]KAK5029936.1 hypothetical protein LTS07_005660 [Exophiala sideris]KAK5031624.1 hypothetical protein LTR13_007613 [Exophiala sideris]KAK5058302.1 hypothetical protein LTR69_006706 [Exophiala sideris]KAK5180231.1 hypothetical protein LTR44_007356 [Eurotiomycetes sp. CCFEE 6388]